MEFYSVNCAAYVGLKRLSATIPDTDISNT